MFVNGLEKNSSINREHPIDASYQNPVHLAKQF